MFPQATKNRRRFPHSDFPVRYSIVKPTKRVGADALGDRQNGSAVTPKRAAIDSCPRQPRAAVEAGIGASEQWVAQPLSRHPVKPYYCPADRGRVGAYKPPRRSVSSLYDRRVPSVVTFSIEPIAIYQTYCSLWDGASGRAGAPHIKLIYARPLFIPGGRANPILRPLRPLPHRPRLRLCLRHPQ